jgi:tripartite-type tricarboxylate transporter receptor subunit TctC
MKNTPRAIALALLGLAALSTQATAAFPDRPVKVFVAWPPGGATDIVGRYVAEQLASVLNQSVIVENRAGANGNIGTELVAKMPADGYTLQIATAESHAINPHVYKNLNYDVARDFEPLALLAKSTFVLATRKDLAANNVSEFVKLAQAKPGSLTVGSYGIGSTSHLTLAEMEERTSTSVLHVVYRGLSPVINALLTGEIDAGFVSANSVVGLQQAGKLKILGTAATERLKVLPDIPTFAEQGVPGFVGGNWYGVVAPKGLPAEAKARLTEALQKVGTSDVFARRAEANGFEVRYLAEADFNKFIQSENDRWGRIVAAKKIEVGQ